MLEKKGYWNIASAWTREFPVWSFMSVEKINWKKKLPNNNQNNREAELMKKKEFYHDTLCILDTYLFS